MTDKMGHKNCDRCAKMCYGRAWIGDSGYGDHVDDCSCPEWDTMTDDEVELENIGECPRFVERKADE